MDKLKFKGTPGPWHVNKNYKNKVSTDINLPIANVSRLLPSTEIKANARLIAAAPDMLEVLQDLVNTWMSPDKSIGEMCYSIENAQRIIKKALDEQ